MRGDQGGKRGGSGPRQRSAAGHETWLLLELGTWILGQLAIQGYGHSIQGFWSFEHAISRVRIRSLGLNQVGRVQKSTGKMIQRADKCLAFDEFSSSRCTLVPSIDFNICF